VDKLLGRAASILQQTVTTTGRRAPAAPAASGLRALLVAQTMQALALVLMGRPSDAEELVRGCLSAAEAQLPSEGPAASDRDRIVASASNCLSEALRELGRLDEAEAACRRGLALREKVRAAAAAAARVGPGPLDQASLRAFSGPRQCAKQIHCSQGARTLLAPRNAALQPNPCLPPSVPAWPPPPLPQEFGPDHPAVALSLASLALALRARQQLPAAAEAATRCLGIRAQHKSTADGPLMAAALNLKVGPGPGGVASGERAAARPPCG
jgi:hypothetical protein